MNNNTHEYLTESNGQDSNSKRKPPPGITFLPDNSPSSESVSRLLDVLSNLLPPKQGEIVDSINTSGEENNQ